jgi:uncharacterized membrane protein YhhN
LAKERLLTTQLVVWTVVLVIALGVHLAAERKRFFGRVLYKMVASTAFVAIALAGGARETPYGRWVLLALALCWIGDWLLAYEDQVLFLIGLFGFLGAHGALMYAFWHTGVNPVWAGAAALAVLMPAGLVARWLKPHVSREMRVPVFAYVAGISVMVVLAAGAVGAGGPPILLPGAVLFYVSDIFVGRQRFVCPGYANTILGLPLYYSAVWCLAVSVSRFVL